MRKRESVIGLLIYLLVLFQSFHCLAIERPSAVGARESALALAVVSIPGSFSVFHNQALLTENRNSAMSASYRQPFFIRGLSESAFSFVYPTSTAVFAVGVSQSSIATYKESSFGISIAKNLTRKLSAGLLFNYFTVNFPEVGGHKGSFQVDGGVRYKYSRQMSLGFHLRNIVSTKAESFQYSLTFPLVVRGGATYQLSERILLTEETIYEKYFGFGFRFGTEYLFNENFCVRCGISTKPFQHSFGFGYRWNIFQLDFAMVHHEMLGYTPSFSVCFSLKQDGNHRF